MKTLLIVRHAKSSWKDAALSDHQRPLNKRGRKAAPEMGRRLKARGVRLDVIVSSDARRAMDTATALADRLGVAASRIRSVSELYHASAAQILEMVGQFDDRWASVMLVGHNPVLTELANRFYPEHIPNLPTAGVVELRFDTSSWRRIQRANLHGSSFDFPKNS
jgi:phosphohistidine phosphatase